MKYFIFVFVLCVMQLCVSCSNDTSNNVVSLGFVHNGHHYLELVGNTPSSRTIVHDPDCRCRSTKGGVAMYHGMTLFEFLCFAAEHTPYEVKQLANNPDYQYFFNCCLPEVVTTALKSGAYWLKLDYNQDGIAKFITGNEYPCDSNVKWAFEMRH